MTNVRVDHEIVTQFLLSTCRERRWVNHDILQACMYKCAAIATARAASDDDDTEYIPVTTGSVAEFYIQPMLSCVGDVDIMYHYGDQLAIPAETAPPTQLPDEFHSRVDVFEIVDSEFPGYVYLVSSYLLTECIDDGKYSAVRCQRLYMRYKVDNERHGPASVVWWSKILPPFVARVVGEHFSKDDVYCMRCLSWPAQAADWPIRRRKYDWPDVITIGHVVSNGCDVVRIAHRLCRQDEWRRQRQYRLSFSRAEIILLNSWNPAQQIVYHMLRVFVKTEQLTDNDINFDVDTLSNYHLKTLMLWACELKPRSWWIDDSNIVTVTIKLLHTLGVWLTDERCRHYFIHNCNLFDHPDNCYSPISTRLM